VTAGAGVFVVVVGVGVTGVVVVGLVVVVVVVVVGVVVKGGIVIDGGASVVVAGTAFNDGGASVVVSPNEKLMLGGASVAASTGKTPTASESMRPERSAMLREYVANVANLANDEVFIFFC